MEKKRELSDLEKKEKDNKTAKKLADVFFKTLSDEFPHADHDKLRQYLAASEELIEEFYTELMSKYGKNLPIILGSLPIKSTKFGNLEQNIDDFFFQRIDDATNKMRTDRGYFQVWIVFFRAVATQLTLSEPGYNVAIIDALKKKFSECFDEKEIVDISTMSAAFNQQFNYTVTQMIREEQPILSSFQKSKELSKMFDIALWLKDGAMPNLNVLH